MSLIDRQAAIDATWFEPSYTDPLNVLTEVRDRPKALPSAQPEPLTDKEQRIFLAAMRRERKVCTYAHEPCEVPLTKVCDEIVRKVKGALWT